MSEQPPTPETGELRARALQLWLEKGGEDIEAQGAYDSWISSEEEKATHAPDTDLAGLQLNIERARFDRDAGLIDSAREQYIDAMKHARQQRKDDLVRNLEEELEALQ